MFRMFVSLGCACVCVIIYMTSYLVCFLRCAYIHVILLLLLIYLIHLFSKLLLFKCYLVVDKDVLGKSIRQPNGLCYKAYLFVYLQKKCCYFSIRGEIIRHNIYRTVREFCSDIYIFYFYK